jgi:hypothetical protein
MLAAVLIVIGFVLGLALRWWGLGPTAVFAVWIGRASEVDVVDPWLLGLMYAAVVAIGVGLGVLTRRVLGSG